MVLFLYKKLRKEGIPMAGRKPKSTAVKNLEGNPGKRKLNNKEPVPARGMPDCPEWLLPEAKKEWQRLCDLMNQMGVLTEVDMAAFAAYCQSFARWKEAQEHIDSDGSTFETDKGYQQQTPWVGIANTNQKLLQASEFGLTPSSRSRIVAGNTKGKEPEGEMEALLGGDS
jgi:P27 family predicted phage terminase small subunit